MRNEEEPPEHPRRSALVDGVVWDDEQPVRWQSMPEYLNFDVIKKQVDPAEYHAPLHGGHGSRGTGDASGRDDESSIDTRPSKACITLSDFLASEESCGSCDFGWFTPSASGGSIDDLVTAAEGGLAFAEPGAPGYPNQPLAASEYASTANTAPLSPLSASREGSAPYSREDLGHLSVGSHAPVWKAGLSMLTSSSLRGGDNSYHSAVGSGSRNSVYGQVAGRGGRGSSAVGSGSSMTVGASRLLRRSSASNRMPEINQWHTLHRHASASGPLAAESEGGGMCTMHLRRSSYPISTRHFPERPPDPRGPWGSGGSRGVVKLNGGSPVISNKGSKRAYDTARGTSMGEGPGGWEGGGFGLKETDEHQLRKAKPKSYAWALTEIRVVTGSSPWAPPRAEYLVVACLGQGKLVAGWRRASDFARLAKVARRYWMSKVSRLPHGAAFRSIFLSDPIVGAPPDCFVHFFPLSVCGSFARTGESLAVLSS